MRTMRRLGLAGVLTACSIAGCDRYSPLEKSTVESYRVPPSSFDLSTQPISSGTTRETLNELLQAHIDKDGRSAFMDSMRVNYNGTEKSDLIFSVERYPSLVEEADEREYRKYLISEDKQVRIGLVNKPLDSVTRKDISNLYSRSMEKIDFDRTGKVLGAAHMGSVIGIGRFSDKGELQDAYAIEITGEEDLHIVHDDATPEDFTGWITSIKVKRSQKK